MTNRIEESLKFHGQYFQRQQRIEIEEVKNNEGQMMMQQYNNNPDQDLPVARAKDP